MRTPKSMLPTPNEDGSFPSEFDINVYQRPLKIVASEIYKNLMSQLPCPGCGHVETSLPWIGWQGACCEKSHKATYGPDKNDSLLQFTFMDVRKMVANAFNDYIGPDFGSAF